MAVKITLIWLSQQPKMILDDYWWSQQSKWSPKAVAEQKNLSMILDEQLTAMIPPPDLWGSTGYTANNNKVGFKYAFLLELLLQYVCI